MSHMGVKPTQRWQRVIRCQTYQSTRPLMSFMLLHVNWICLLLNRVLMDDTMELYWFNLMPFCSKGRCKSLVKCLFVCLSVCMHTELIFIHQSGSYFLHMVRPVCSMVLIKQDRTYRICLCFFCSTFRWKLRYAKSLLLGLVLASHHFSGHCIIPKFSPFLKIKMYFFLCRYLL